MSGELLNQVRKDVKKIVSEGEFTDMVTLTTPDGQTSIGVGVLSTKHHINFDTDGLPANSMNAHICLVESTLTEKNYIARDLRGEINLRNHRVDAKDSNGTLKSYTIIETLPNDSTGFIVCILGKFNQN